MINLYNYQDKVINFMENIEKDYISGGMICLDMGLGKSITSLELIFRNVNKYPITLIVVPKTLLNNWEQEFNKYKVGREKLTFKIYYNVEIKRQTFQENIILTTYETIKKYQQFLKPLFSRIILDESQNIRNAKNELNKQIIQLKSLKKWCLSGTPFFNNYQDMYAQCKFIDISPFNIKKNWNNPTELFLNNFRKNFCYILKKEDALVGNQKLPKISYHEINPKLNKTELEIYNQFQQFINERGNTLSYLIKIRQSCCNSKVMTKVDNHCAICTDYTPTTRKFKCGHFICWHCYRKRRSQHKKCHVCKIDSTKFDEILKIYKDSEKQDKIVIFTQWKGIVMLLEKYLSKKQIKSHIIHGAISLTQRNQIIESFKTDTNKILIATIQTCGVGINLTCANHVVLLDSWWNASLENQAIDRLYRIGQTKEVNVYHIIINKSIEKWIEFKQRQKKIQTQILFNEKHNEEYRWLGESYGLYSNKKTSDVLRKHKFFKAKKMSKLSMNSYLNRDFLYSHDKEMWAKSQGASRIIQRFFKRFVTNAKHKQQTKEHLDKYFYEDITNIIYEYTFYTTAYFQKSIKL